MHDWDGKDDLDVFVNYEEDRYSRRYFAACGSPSLGDDATNEVGSEGVPMAK